MEAEEGRTKYFKIKYLFNTENLFSNPTFFFKTETFFQNHYKVLN